MSSAEGEYVRIRKIVDKGPDSARWNLLIFAEGYLQGDLGYNKKFHKDAMALVADLLTVSPFDEFKTAVNVHRVDISSAEKGAWMPPPCGSAGPPKKTFFDARFCNGGRQEYLTVDTDAVIALAKNIFPEFDALVVLVNEDVYGGSGDFGVAVCTRKPSTRKLVAHELGHSAFALADEYDGPNVHANEEPAAANVTLETRSAHLKWKGLLSQGVPIPTTLNATCGASKTTTLGPGTVGAFEGARTCQCNVFRPSANCRMRDWTAQFCKVCKAEIRARLQPFLP
jgi:IgA Peptidase M64